MNDVTPRRMTGTLIERAAALYDLQPDAFAARQPYAAAPAFDSGYPGGTPLRAVAPVKHDRPAAVVDRAALQERGMIVPGTAVTALAEQFRLVKRQLLQTSRKVEDADKARAILVCSARPGDGKTWCAVNLALSLAAERDVEVLLVDADFAKPDVLPTLGVVADGGPGLLDALADPTLDVETCIADTDVPQLALLPAGTRMNGDTELLASDRARAVLHRLVSANPRRIVIFDSPPALAASPAAELAANVGQVMLVVRADRTSESDLRESVALLDGCEHVQLVLNAVAFQPGGPRFGDYYGQESVA
ncbi:AAA family ATPase [Sphingomonas donggukensis]|uniref:AAA family ATPase n=1 Tax=Sphingomonas donggukensis TaxID=2949093 RepID=A0ABY4TWP7_9SPHN|nr:AAA family ATPase [Sphingomonas donggukensis]URW76777.1 AAA family ATPase [Sphingomonas donggukensis]